MWSTEITWHNFRGTFLYLKFYKKIFYTAWMTKYICVVFIIKDYRKSCVAFISCTWTPLKVTDWIYRFWMRPKFSTRWKGSFSAWNCEYLGVPMTTQLMTLKSELSKLSAMYILSLIKIFYTAWMTKHICVVFIIKDYRESWVAFISCTWTLLKVTDWIYGSWMRPKFSTRWRDWFSIWNCKYLGSANDNPINDLKLRAVKVISNIYFKFDKNILYGMND